MASSRFHAGDWVVYTKQKVSESPGKRAQEISAAEKGDSYTYVVDKYWTVSEALANGQLRLRTRRGKQHLVDSADPMLRRARWWEKLLYYRRFQPQNENEASQAQT